MPPRRPSWPCRGSHERHRSNPRSQLPRSPSKSTDGIGRNIAGHLAHPAILQCTLTSVLPVSQHGKTSQGSLSGGAEVPGRIEVIADRRTERMYSGSQEVFGRRAPDGDSEIGQILFTTPSIIAESRSGVGGGMLRMVFRHAVPNFVSSWSSRLPSGKVSTSS
jgi:hypothetical protein